MPASVLDARDTYERLDPRGLYGRIAGLPEQIAEAWAAASALALPASYRDVDRVVVLGMGGSGIGGSLMQALAVDIGARTPVSVVRGYTLPAWVDARTLVLASSNSGNTEETVTALRAAIAAGACCAVIATGGAAGDLAKEHALPWLAFAWKASRARRSAGAPRRCSRSAAPGPAAGPRAGLRPRSMRCAAAEQVARDVPEASNAAKQLARRLAGKLPVFIGAQALAPVAYRWRTQVNENAKSWAIAEELPEMNHNAPLGYGAPKDLLPLLRAVILRHAAMHPRIRLRVEATLEQLTAAGVGVEAVDVPGPSLLAQVLWAIELGDFTSYYMGLLHGVDPSHMRALESLKAYLAARPRT
jgi:glucose/mannose-6-phosphate isomerase